MNSTPLLACWPCHRSGETVSLLDMIESSLSAWTEIGAALEVLENLMHPDTVMGLLSEKKPLIIQLQKVAQGCLELKLMASADNAADLIARLLKYQTPTEALPDSVPWPPLEEVKSLLKSWREIRGEDLTVENFVWNVRELRRSIERELGARVFVSIDPAQIGHYQTAAPFGNEVVDKFPSALTDSVEAAKCLA